VLEVPGFAGDLGRAPEVIPEFGGVRTKTQFPDMTGHLRYDGMWGHVQIAGVARWITFDNPPGIDGFPSGTVFGWGVNLTGAPGGLIQNCLEASTSSRRRRRAKRPSGMELSK
jgi:hypothetical protein